MIAEALLPLAVDIEWLKTLDGNPRRGDVTAVARSLNKFGQRKPIVARKDDGTVIAGNHTLLAARDLGWTELAAVLVDDDAHTAKAYALADNRTSQLGTFDADDLQAMIGELVAVDPELLHAASYDDKDIAKLLGDIEHGDSDTSPQLEGGGFAIIVECTDEDHQRQLLDTFDAEGLQCRPLMM